MKTRIFDLGAGGLAALLVLLLGACTQAAEPAPREVVVHKSPTCGCCKLWARHLTNAGFSVQAQDSTDISPVKKRLGVPATMQSCHTAEIEGYFVEGHVPVADIERLLRERPKAKGLAVPGMPAGSPGMEVPSGKIAPYEVFLIDETGKATVFARHGS